MPRKNEAVKAADDHRCPDCGACKTCGAPRQQPIIVYPPVIVQPQPRPAYPWTYPYNRPYTLPQTTWGGPSPGTQVSGNTVWHTTGGNYAA